MVRIRSFRNTFIKLLSMGLASLCLALSLPALADPCDFATGSENGQVLFPHAQVMECFGLVPLDPEEPQEMYDILTQSRERSHLRGVYQQQYFWRDSLAALRDGSYAGDFDFQTAVVLDHMAFQNGHFFYIPPTCYSDMLVAVLPIDLGSMIYKGEQIIYVEGVPGWDPEIIAAYENLLGEPLSNLIGMRLESINGQDPLAYFHDQAATVLQRDTSEGTTLNAILTDQFYHVRPMFRTFPAQDADELILVSKSGNTVRQISLPWVFTQVERFLGPDLSIPPSGSTAEFVETCFEPNPLLASEDLDPQALKRLGFRDHEELMRRDEQMRAKLARNMRHAGLAASRGGFYEFPPGLRGKGVTELSVGPSFESYQYKNRATIIKMYDFVGDWSEQVQEATAHACDNSDYLVFDLTENNGGFVVAYEWLGSHLDPQPPGAIPRGFIRSVPTFIDYEYDILVTLAFVLSGPPFNIGLDSCPAEGFGVQPGCYNDAATGAAYTSLDWLFNLRPEQRGTDVEWVNTPHFSPGRFPPWQYPGPPIACPGKFGKDNLIMLVDGTNASAGYFFPAGMQDMATLISIGGFVDGDATLGSMRGGNVVSVAEVTLNIQAGLDFGLPFISTPLYFSRNVDSTYEQAGAYRQDLLDTDDPYQLHIVNPVIPERRLPLWGSTTLDTSRGYIYRAVVDSLD